MGASSGFQNSDGGWVTADSVAVAFGHGYGSPIGQSIFLNSTYLRTVTAAAACRARGARCSKTAPWERLPDAPVDGRQDVASAVIDGAVYIVGGFSYSPPYSYSDFLRLDSDVSGEWSWTPLPSFPYPVNMHGGSSIGTKLYVQGGACCNRKMFYNYSGPGKEAVEMYSMLQSQVPNGSSSLIFLAHQRRTLHSAR